MKSFLRRLDFLLWEPYEILTCLLTTTHQGQVSPYVCEREATFPVPLAPFTDRCVTPHQEQPSHFTIGGHVPGTDKRDLTKTQVFLTYGVITLMRILAGGKMPGHLVSSMRWASAVRKDAHAARFRP